MRRGAGRGRILLVALVGVAMLAGLAGPARGGQPVVLGCASAANLKGLFVKLGQLAEKFVPGTGAQVQGASGMLTQDPQWAGVDWSKPATVVLFGGKAFGKTEPVPVVVASLADAGQFRQAHPEGAPVAFDIRGNLVVVSPEKAALAAMTPRRMDIYGDFPKIAAGTDAYLTVYITSLLAEYKDEIESGLKEIEQSAAEMPMAGPMANLTSIVKTFGPLVRLAGQQVRRVTATITFQPEAIEVWSRVYAVADSPLAGFLAGQPAETTDLVKYLPADAVMSVSGKLDISKAKPLVDAVIGAVAAPLGLDAEEQAQIRELIFASTQTGEFATALAGGQNNLGMQVVQVFRIGDEAKFRAATKSTTEWLTKTGFGGFMEAAGVKMTVEHKPGAREYKGVAIDRLTVSVTPAPGAPPNPMMGQQPPQVTELAAVGTLGASATNSADGALLNAVLDRIKGGGTPGFDTSPVYKAIRAAAPKGANVIVHVGFNSMLAKLVEEMAKQQPAIAMMAAAMIKADPAEEPITSYATFGSDRLDIATRIPHQPILNLVTRVRKMIEQQQRRPGGRPGAKPKNEDDF